MWRAPGLEAQIKTLFHEGHTSLDIEELLRGRRMCTCEEH
jgi:hypothetical protein